MKMHEKKLKRFSDYGKIANVLFIIIIVGGALLTLAGAIGAIYLNVSDFDLEKAANFIFENELPGVRLLLEDSINISYSVVYILLINMVLSIVLAAVAVKSVSIMFKHTVTEGTPFNQKSVRYIKVVGNTFIIYALAVCLLGIMTGLFSPNPSWNVSIKIGYVLIGLLILALGEMFEFGKDLQEDNESIL